MTARSVVVVVSNETRCHDDVFLLFFCFDLLRVYYMKTRHQIQKEKKKVTATHEQHARLVSYTSPPLLYGFPLAHAIERLAMHNL